VEIDLAGWIFGCDVCQEVCPYNSPKYNRVTNEKDFFPLSVLSTSSGMEAEGLSAFTEEQFNTIFAESPVKRTKFSGWKRNMEALK